MENTVINETVFTQLLVDVGEDMLPALVDVFKEETTERIADLRALMASVDNDKVAQSCHSIKSSAGTYGALIVQQHAEELEVMAKSNSTAEVQVKLPLLIKSLEDAISALTLKCD
ncbi:Hpt domain-containing protein [Moritella sp. Urea-trap-13]|uniref:Hpt domain-containing protein n=1 Tax=Moritella sp. Urea-trap-13 TaxID=2058327 RepID=UPI000C33181A|nr:Hpt domain-containing protein [Moritella sp. Urea-trap-13]PKH06552.1 phosphorelay protein [Moritella sp. Urea-trap-13]